MVFFYDSYKKSKYKKEVWRLIDQKEERPFLWPAKMTLSDEEHEQNPIAVAIIFIASARMQ